MIDKTLLYIDYLKLLDVIKKSEAEVLVVNTCSFIEAAQRVYLPMLSARESP